MKTNLRATTDPKEDKAMPRVTVRRAAEITLPQEAAEMLGVTDGGELEVELVEGGVLLRPVDAREKGWERVFKAMEAVEYVGPEPEPSEDEVMEMVVEEIHTMRREHEEKSRSR